MGFNIFFVRIFMATLRSSKTFLGREMAGARALWKANGMKNKQVGKPIIAIVNSFTQFVPGHVHLHEVGQMIKKEIFLMHLFQIYKSHRPS